MSEESTSKHCQSCACPVEGEYSGPNPRYCKYCVDDHGKLLPKERIRSGVAKWLKELEPEIDDQTALRRADHYMLSMPAWAKD